MSGSTERFKRRHYLERECLLEALVIGAALADEKFRASLPAAVFQGGMRHVLECLQEPKKHGMDALNRWLESSVGVERENGERVLDAAIRQMSKNAELAAIERSGDKLTATLIRFHEACERRRQKRDTEAS